MTLKLFFIFLIGKKNFSELSLHTTPFRDLLQTRHPKPPSFPSSLKSTIQYIGLMMGGLVRHSILFTSLSNLWPNCGYMPTSIVVKIPIRILRFYDFTILKDLIDPDPTYDVNFVGSFYPVQPQKINLNTILRFYNSTI